MLDKIHLLIVDDEVDFLDTVSQRMEMRGFDVYKASNGTLAIEACKSKKYDIALLDLKMPGLNGFEVLEILKKEHKYIEVIILTAHGSLEAAFETSKLGAFSFLTKPFDFEKLIDTIRDAYQTRLKKKFSETSEKADKVSEIISKLQYSENSLDVLEELKKLDDEIK